MASNPRTLSIFRERFLDKIQEKDHWLHVALLPTRRCKSGRWAYAEVDFISTAEDGAVFIHTLREAFHLWPREIQVVKAADVKLKRLEVTYDLFIEACTFLAVERHLHLDRVREFALMALMERVRFYDVILSREEAEHILTGAVEGRAFGRHEGILPGTDDPLGRAEWSRRLKPWTERKR